MSCCHIRKFSPFARPIFSILCHWDRHLVLRIIRWTTEAYYVRPRLGRHSVCYIWWSHYLCYIFKGIDNFFPNITRLQRTDTLLVSDPAHLVVESTPQPFFGMKRRRIFCLFLWMKYLIHSIMKKHLIVKSFAFLCGPEFTISQKITVMGLTAWNLRILIQMRFWRTALPEMLLLDICSIFSERTSKLCASLELRYGFLPQL